MTKKALTMALALAIGGVLAVGCSDDEPSTTSPGSCIRISGEQAEGVDCEGDDVQFIVVDSGLSFPLEFSCPDGTADQDIRRQRDGQDVPGVEGQLTLCVVAPDELTAEHEELIAENKAEREQN